MRLYNPFNASRTTVFTKCSPHYARLITREQLGHTRTRLLATRSNHVAANTSGAGFDSIRNNNVRQFIETHAAVMQPDCIHVCDGSEQESQHLLKVMQSTGMIKRLPKYDNCWLARSDPRDVARVESKTVIVTDSKSETSPTPHPEGTPGQLNIWMSPNEFKQRIDSLFPNCMNGRTMYVIPFSMGPVGSPLSKIGIQLTDSPYVVASMRIMTRMGDAVWGALPENDQSFVKCVHSVGAPYVDGQLAPGVESSWPCNPEKVLVGHIPALNEIISFGSNYGGNSLLGKKCFALRLASCLARDEGWLAEHMLILGITNPAGEKRYIAAAFPSACGKTNMAMMKPSLPGWKVECVGDDIAWMKFDSQGKLRAINPEAGFFGVAPGTSNTTNPFAMETISRNTVFTNTAETSDGGVYWEGMDVTVPDGVSITDWKNNAYDLKAAKKGSPPCAHANSRFCAPASQCPIIDPAWEDPAGVPIDAIVFGGRRPAGIPLVYESLDWAHGVFVGASMRSEATAAAENKGKIIMHDPFAMRPFFGYNFGHYLQHWLSFADANKFGKLQLPKIFHVNWFRKHPQNGSFLWPGFGENSRVLEWMFRRVAGESKIAVDTPIGRVPAPNTINLEGLKESIDMDELLAVRKDFWQEECSAIEKYLTEQVNKDLPADISQQLQQLKQRTNQLSS